MIIVAASLPGHVLGCEKGDAAKGQVAESFTDAPSGAPADNSSVGFGFVGSDLPGDSGFRAQVRVRPEARPARVRFAYGTGVGVIVDDAGDVWRFDSAAGQLGYRCLGHVEERRLDRMKGLTEHASGGRMEVISRGCGDCRNDAVSFYTDKQEPVVIGTSGDVHQRSSVKEARALLLWLRALVRDATLAGVYP